MPLIRKYCIQLLRALHYLHETAGIVHGDLKRKKNVKLSADVCLLFTHFCVG